MDIIKVQYIKKEDGSNEDNNFKITFSNETITFVGRKEGTHFSNVLDKWEAEVDENGVSKGNKIEEAD